MEPACKSHPLYKYRRILLINAVVSLVLGLVALTYSGYNAAIWEVHIFLILVSAFICFYDLMKWVSQKATDPENDPKWPLKIVMVVDALLAAALTWEYLVELFDSDTSYYYSHNNGSFMQAYASLTILLASLLHGHCFWKELMTIKKRQWLAALPTSERRCDECSVVGGDDPPANSVQRNPESFIPAAHKFFTQSFTSRSTAQEPDIEATAGSSTLSGCLITPMSNTEDDGLSDSSLLGKDGGYGTMKPAARGEPTIRYDDENVSIIKKKAGKNKNPKGKDRSESREGLPISFA